MEWIREILEKASITDGKLDVEAVITKVNAEFPKHAVTKKEFDDKVEELKTANQTIKTMEEENADNEELQKKITGGTINWTRVKYAGVDFAILKVIDKTGNTEGAFEWNYAGATAHGIAVGVYNYSYATTVQKAQEDAQRVIGTLRGRKLQCKIWLDVEDNCQKKLGKTLVNIINAYKAAIEAAGYEFGVYTGLSFYNSYIKPYAAQISCQFWIARYPSTKTMQITDNPAASKKPAILHPLWGWPWTSAGSVPGISGNADMNIMYAELDSETGQAVAGNPYQEPDYTLYRYRIGMKKEHVRWLQYELNELGYGLTVEGAFGKATDMVLKDAQKRLGLVVDGKCGQATRAKLKSV